MLLQIVSKLIKVIIRILGIQTEADLGLWTNMEVVLRMVPTTSTILPVTLNTTIGTTKRIMKHILLNCCQYLLKGLQNHFHTQILVKLPKILHCFQLSFHCC